VELQAKYRHAGLYTLFVIAYLLVLYLQASAYKSGEVVRTLKQVMMPKDEDGNLLATTTFKDQNAVLGHLWSNILEPTWKDPVCGDQKCEYPWEFPAYGRFGCRADCGMHQNLTKILVVVQHDFTGHPTANPRVLMSAATWNLCQNDANRRARGEADLCWWDNQLIGPEKPLLPRFVDQCRMCCLLLASHARLLWGHLPGGKTISALRR